jgi:acetylornithine/succinyldiaminopimelate/putrescine aminotransferase
MLCGIERWVGEHSMGASHPHYVNRLEEQLNKIAFYSNAVENPLQHGTIILP